MSLSVIYQDVSPELLVTKLKSGLAHHHMQRNLETGVQYIDKPLTHNLLRSARHLLLSQRIPYDWMFCHKSYKDSQNFTTFAPQ